jgi:hypothetical protein
LRRPFDAGATTHFRFEAAMGKSKKLPKWTKIDVELPKAGKLTLYAGSKVSSALHEVTTELDLYQGVRLSEVMEAIYEQGLKNGRREVIEQFDHQIMKKVNYLPPGRPKKSKRSSSRG